MEISGIADSVSSTQAVGSKTLGKEDFMRLLLKQLSYQDPLNPMDSTQFTSQLTQFSSLEQLNNINTTLNDVLAFQHSMQNASLTDMIGRTIRVLGNTTYLVNTADLNYQLSGDAASVRISIYDGAKNLIASKDVGAQFKGENNFIWDGKDSAGNQMPEGVYSYEVQARDASGNAVAALTNASGIVTGVNFSDGNTYLVLNGGRSINPSEIQSIQ